MREPKLILPANTTYADLVGKKVISNKGYPGIIANYYSWLDGFPIWVQFFHNGDEAMYTRNGYLRGSNDYITLATITQPSLALLDRRVNYLKENYGMTKEQAIDYLMSK